MLSDIPCVVCNIHLTKYAYKINQKIIAVEAFASISCIFIYHTMRYTMRKLTGSGANESRPYLTFVAHGEPFAHASNFAHSPLFQ